MELTGNMGLFRVELNHMTRGTSRVLKDSLGVFRDATAFLIHAAADHHEELSLLNSRKQLTMMEGLCHKTKGNPDPAYPEFDTLFYKFPSYIRRAAIHGAVGHVLSHETRCDLYYGERDVEIARGHHYKKMEPAFTFTPGVFPTLYKKESFRLSGNTVKIKAYVRSTWDWVEVSMPSRDYKRLQRAMGEGTLKNPRLVYAYHKFYLEFPVVYKTRKMPDTPLSKQLVLGADLGLNHGAVLSVSDASGTIHARAFDPFKADRDRIGHVISLIRKKSATSGKGQSLASLYTKLEGLKDNYVKQLARWITNKALEHGVYGIVLEHLGSVHHGRRKKGNLPSRVHHWCVARIRDYIRGMAYREGIRVFIINPKGTSMYAYDGSGKVTRDKDNHSLCTFRNGKRYHADLSASYNIGARYFLRAYRKSMPEKAWSELAAEVPGLSRRTGWTLSTLWALAGSMAS